MDRGRRVENRNTRTNNRTKWRIFRIIFERMKLFTRSLITRTSYEVKGVNPVKEAEAPPKLIVVQDPPVSRYLTSYDAPGTASQERVAVDEPNPSTFKFVGVVALQTTGVDERPVTINE